MRPTVPVLNSVNHSAPSGPVVITLGKLLAVGIRKSVATPAVVMRPILLAPEPGSLNHNAPSGPVVMLPGNLPAVAVANSAITPSGVHRPTVLGGPAVDHRAPSRL